MAKVRLPFGVAVLTAEGVKETSNWQCEQIVRDVMSGGLVSMPHQMCEVPTTNGAELEVTGISVSGIRATVEFKKRMIPNRVGQQLLKEKMSLEEQRSGHLGG